MGQQQLILLVLATVIVGIAIVVGIRAFTENSAKANADAMIQDGVRMANDLQAWKKKPEPFGGQGQNCTTDTPPVCTDYATNVFTGATFPALGYGGTDTEYTNLNGTFTFAPATGTFTGENLAEGNTVVITVTGITDADIDGEITCLGNTAIGTGVCPTAAE